MNVNNSQFFIKKRLRENQFVNSHSCVFILVNFACIKVYKCSPSAGEISFWENSSGSAVRSCLPFLLAYVFPFACLLFLPPVSH